jgi:hypothetical protein
MKKVFRKLLKISRIRNSSLICSLIRNSRFRIPAGPPGEVTVAELDWGNEEQIKAVSPPFDLVVAADVVSFHSSQVPTCCRW